MQSSADTWAQAKPAWSEMPVYSAAIHLDRDQLPQHNAFGIKSESMSGIKNTDPRMDFKTDSTTSFKIGEIRSPKSLLSKQHVLFPHLSTDSQ